MSKIQNVLNHVGIIMDGNGRWATQIGKSRLFGHKKGIESIKKIIQVSVENNLKVLTLYAFSIENFNRPKDEVNGIMNIFINSLKNETNNLNKLDIKIKIIGDINKLNKKLIFYIKKTENITKNNKKLILNIAINYSGKWDIMQAFNKINNDIKLGILKIKIITEKIIKQYISINSNFNNIDLLIRTGGEKRISNFTLWNIAYSELYFTNILWPDFNEHEYKKSLDFFYKANRKFGKLR